MAHDIIFKLKKNGIAGNLLNLLSSFLRNRKQRVVLNGETSSWSDINARVPQVFILGPLLFLVYINDLADAKLQNYSQMILHYFLLFIMQILQQRN